VTARASRIGLESRIGLDFVLAVERAPRAPLGGVSALGSVAPILGVDARLAPGSGAALADGGPLSIGDFSLR
jgi:hypothetical protein